MALKCLKISLSPMMKLLVYGNAGHDRVFRVIDAVPRAGSGERFGAALKETWLV